MELKFDKKIIRELKGKGYNVNEMAQIIKEELMDYDFEGSTLFDVFFHYDGKMAYAQGKVTDGVAHCYGMSTNLKIIEE
ncbi:hypothetical protein [Gudongella sp. SC589]|jgi:hypothetical protein|uniref:hypothetical protein n=1 Tax=Gudongella sp. SC589 TaxID=3385990 RepID=UPI003904C5B7